LVSARLSGKTAIVIGAGSIGPGWGNGKAIAARLAQEGAQVLCVDRNHAAASETAEIIVSQKGTAHAMRGDATIGADLNAARDECLSRYGKIDILVNNVGIVLMGGVVEISELDWDRVFAVNLKSCFLAMKSIIPTMEKAGGGAIVNISSIASIRYTGMPYATYYATKAAVNHLTRTTAAQYAPMQIRVNAVLPGLMKTPMVEATRGLVEEYGQGDIEKMWRERAAQVPMKHVGDAWDVANAVLYLASDEARYVTGAELLVDGGITLKMS
jgi:NAD(P)-dependent dehydrogenase (short-subunit alcohol dehydrogenase family)